MARTKRSSTPADVTTAYDARLDELCPEDITEKQRARVGALLAKRMPLVLHMSTIAESSSGAVDPESALPALDDLAELCTRTVTDALKIYRKATKRAA
jgi:hypothetical protein